MNPTAIEQAIITRLAPLRTISLTVRALPNKTSEYGEINGNGQVTVMWQKDTADIPLSLGVVQQKVESLWKFDIRLKNLRDVNGGWAVIRAIATLLIGYKPPGCNRMYLKSREFIGESEKGLWVFEAMFAIQTMVIELPPEEAGTLLETIVFETDAQI